ncbi:large conductance mechanosensitive channel protein MscL [Pontixanthobacter aestiaquae]|uniref:Large-conductance mechanosensitive channel n=1 Tax=Pontixanthobacter aestiaquae TaxID=1509367 RepID=A0A844Z9Z2_9SPHN|nr:large conductance mechanosensitive channel protein MscL [Pontixanthobacter aestiaquae]MDN3644867.1 large conductance mechanosensitive channel protein MscL [Pontixanthobacter aestiaquae]MXO84132.1 large conductance mechanosensitive channel protein MscL [Pontixanthobacter aestiaquae]
MTVFDEFKKFISRGNVLQLAVGVVIGAAFGKITTALTESVLMPFIGWLFGAVDFTNWFIRLGSIPEGYAGSTTNYAELKQAGVAMIGYGDLLTQIVNFLILAFALFLLIKGVNKVLDAIEEDKKAMENSSDSDKVPTDPQLDVLRDIRLELRGLREAQAK